MTRRRLFALLDRIAAGLEREAAMPEDERAAKAAQIQAWFEPLLRAIQAAEAEHPCAAGGGRLVLAVASGEILEDTRPAPAPARTAFARPWTRGSAPGAAPCCGRRPCPRPPWPRPRTRSAPPANRSASSFRGSAGLQPGR